MDATANVNAEMPLFDLKCKFLEKINFRIILFISFPSFSQSLLIESLFNLICHEDSTRMIEWANSEIGVIIHFDIEVFDPTWIHLKGNTLNPPQILHVLIPINWTPINGFR